jgi:thiamine-phosphate pyrophosphorylase
MANLSPALAKLNSSLANPRWPNISIYMTNGNGEQDLLPTLADLPAGTWVIFRHYQYDDRLSLARKVAEVCRLRRLPLLIAGDSRLAQAVNADGIHLPGFMLRRPNLIQRRPGWIVSAAIHTITDLDRAKTLGVDLGLVSPVFRTRSHPGARTMGIFGLRRFCRNAKFPVIALGGISERNMKAVASSGAAGIAAISLFENSAQDR